MPAPEIAQVPRVHLEGVDAVPDEGESMTREGVGERLDPSRFPDAGPDPRRYFPAPRHDPFLQFDSVPAYMESFSAIFRICTPCTREAPPRIAAATWTASVISPRFDPFSRQARV